MKHRTTKILMIMIIAALLIPLSVTPVFAGPLFPVNDTMETHPVYVPTENGLGADYDANVPGVASGKGDFLIADMWQASPTFGGGGWQTDYRIRYDKQFANSWNGNDADLSNKVLALRSINADSSYQAAINLVADIGTAPDGYMYSADLRNYFEGNCNPVMGIRIVDPANETNYYELALISNTGVANTKAEAQVSAPRFTKVSGANVHTPAVASTGNEPSQWLYSEYGTIKTASGLYNNNNTHHTDWFSVSLGIKGNTIFWRVYDKTTEELIWEDSYTDNEPLFDSVGKLTAFTYGADTSRTVFLDNVTAKKSGLQIYKENDSETELFKDTIENHPLDVPTGNGLGADYDANVPGVATGKGDVLTTEWQTSPTFGGGGWATDYRIQYDKTYANSWSGSDNDIETDKVISLKSVGSGDNIQAAINLNKTVNTDGSGYVYSVDMRNYFNGSCNPVMGIRLVDPSNEANYYELALISNTGVANSLTEAQVSAPRFTKVVGADINTPAIAASGFEPSAWQYTEYGDEKTASGLYPAGSHRTDWFTLTLGISGNRISWSVKNKTSGASIWEGSWVDENRTLYSTGKLCAFTYGGNERVFVNNVTLSKYVPGGLKLEGVWKKDTETAPTLYIAYYDDNNALIGVSTPKTDAGKEGTYNDIITMASGALIMKAFLWDGSTPLCLPDSYEEGDIKTVEVKFPTYSNKAFTISIDDGNPERDAAIIDAMKKYGIKGTFNLCSGNSNGTYNIYVDDAIEISNHTTHIEMYQEPATYNDCINSIETAADSIVYHHGVDYPKGLVWPFHAPKERDFYDDLITYAKGRGYEYSRDSHVNGSFEVPSDWMDWQCTTWTYSFNHAPVYSYADQFASMAEPGRFQIFSVAGHGNDLDEQTSADLYEYVFSKMAADESIWKATNLEICLYTKAAQKLEITDKYVYNPTDIDIYAIINGTKTVVKAKSYAESY